MSQYLATLFEAILAERAEPELDVQFPFYPLTSPGMPLPGPDFVAAAVGLGDTSPQIVGTGADKRAEACGKNLHYLYRRALYDEQFQLPIAVKGRYISAPFVPGHLWGHTTRGGSGGPRLARVMVVGKNPGQEEVQAGRNFVGPTSEELTKAFSLLGISDQDVAGWYITNLVKFPNMDRSGGGNSIPVPWLKDCLPLLHQELRLVRPDFMLCLGSEASKTILGKEYPVSAMTGRVLELKIPLHEWGEEPQWHTIKVMTAMHPAAVYRKPELADEMIGQLGLFWQLVGGGDVGNDEHDIDHGVIYKERELAALVDQIIADPDPWSRFIAVDAEWHGEPGEPGGYLRTIQFSHKPKFARTVVLRYQGGMSAFKPSPERAIYHLNRLLKSTPSRKVRVGGHFFRADLAWLIRIGLDLRDEYAPHPDVNNRGEGGWDTSLAYHAVNETARFKLEDMATRLTTVPRYDAALAAWRKEYCYRHKLKADDLEGYGECLHGRSKVQLGDGSWRPIGLLVRRKYAGTVRAVVDGRQVETQVRNWHRTFANQQEWYKLRMASTPRYRGQVYGPVFTPDHRVITQYGKVRVDRLVVGKHRIVTEEPAFSADQIAVLLGSALGGGGFRLHSVKGVGFGFGQAAARASYAEWKAAVLVEHGPRPRRATGRRYELPVSRKLYALLAQYPVHPRSGHTKRKLIITRHVLQSLGVLGLAVWYQDGGSLVKCGDRSRGYALSRLYCEASETEIQCVLSWLRDQFGDPITYNTGGHFFQISRDAFRKFHAAINPYVHPACAYKTTLPLPAFLPAIAASQHLFEEAIEEVVPHTPAPTHKDNGTRYCLTTDAGNFLTQAGFVSNCPDWVLHPDRKLGQRGHDYASYDADAARRCAVRLFESGGLLERDWFGNDSWRAYWNNHGASLAVLEMEETGFVVDKNRVDELTNLFMAKRDQLLQELRAEINWADFNPASHPQTRAFLFGDQYGFKLDKVTGQKVPVRPYGAVTMELAPIKTTGKRSKQWSRISFRDQDQYTPSCDKETLGILGHRNPSVAKLRDIKFIGQVLISVLRVPNMREDGLGYDTDEDGNFVYEKGIAGSALSDGRVHTHFFQNKETGRGSSARPPLQNISTRREDDYARILGELYRHPVRSILTVPPGCVGIDADLTGAELAAIAWLAQDQMMIEHVRRNMLDEDHPDHYDMHAQQAGKAFRLQGVTLTKTGMKNAGKKGLRVAAKNVNFGVPYGRGATAIARQCGEEGADITDAEAQLLIDAYHETYSRVSEFLAECAARSQDPRWMCNPWGRYRRMAASSDPSVVGDQERQFQNFDIQSSVADAVWEALRHLWHYRERVTPDRSLFKFMLTVHDSIVLLVPYRHAWTVYNEVLPTCLRDQVAFWPTYLDGSRMPHIREPYHFGIDRSVFVSWGEELKPTDEIAQRLGIPNWLAPTLREAVPAA